MIEMNGVLAVIKWKRPVVLNGEVENVRKGEMTLCCHLQLEKFVNFTINVMVAPSCVKTDGEQSQRKVYIVFCYESFCFQLWFCVIMILTK